MSIERRELEEGADNLGELFRSVTKRSTNIPPVSKESKLPTSEEVLDTNRKRWRNINVKYSHIYDEMGDYCRYTNSPENEWDSMVKYIIDQVFKTIRHNNTSNDPFIKSSIEYNYNSIINNLNAISILVKDIDKLEILCKLQSYIDNTL